MKVKNIFISFLLFYLLHLNTTVSSSEILDPIAVGNLNFTQIAHRCGLQCEEHEVITEDGYILTLFRLPGNKSQPVFLLSGNLGSADDYIARENTSLPVILWASGYDVWVGNWRGCKYGRRHLALKPDRDKEFWDFSFHEYALLDVPALIDYVLQKTGSKRVACVAWSLGTTVFYILGSMKPEFVDKVAVLISLAPIGYLHHSVTFLKVIPFYPYYDAFFQIMNMEEIFGDSSMFSRNFRYVCRSERGYDECVEGWVFPDYGYDTANFEPEFTPIMFGHFPSPISRKTLGHMAQIVRHKRITQYDYGPSTNMKKYGSAVAPNYELQKNNMSIVMISSKNDLASTLPDVEMLKALLPNVVAHVLLEPGEFNHFAFTYGRTSHRVLYKPYILGYLNKYL